MNADQIQRLVSESGIEQVRIAWCDTHGELRAKSILPRALPSALKDGIGMVGTQALKDTSDRTAFKVFEPDGLAHLPMLAEFAQASNFMVKPIPESFRQLPWAEKTGWLQAQMIGSDGHPLTVDSRSILQKALSLLEEKSYGMRCGLEIEFHIYKIENARPQTDPELAAWPGLPPAVSMIHPGYRLLSERWLDRADEPLQIVRKTCAALGLPLTSLEVEFGPSQVEAVFEVQDALAAADSMVLFRSAATQALQRAGYHASFMCRPPFPGIMSSGWHLHQSLVDLETGRNTFTASGETLSEVGQHWLAGLLAHAQGICALANPTLDAYERFRPNALAPTRANWGIDSRSAMLRVINADSHSASSATRIENRIGSPLANPYLYLASQIHAGLDGVARKLQPPRAEDDQATALPASLKDALTALQTDTALSEGFGEQVLTWYAQIKRQEIARHDAAQDKLDWIRREYFSRF
ncbi:glutamine synthetase family protein [Variovorax sp. PCZ-1]|uniref:glutamine synthetase family protein n=1 Tax=Variovorax sp. PCZ-1 TaxID=2835533 RepID=UPI001BCBB1DC|nr:glutamine synthetase family protein [Variovorax sp. PCZ-1]MBS7808528.1 glutamine synthetase [Variovorax sp. PCZ-1]